MRNQYFWDENGVRYDLAISSGEKPYNWLVMPGGPGGDSRYLKTLLEEVHLPGNVWLLDFPGNGDNFPPGTSPEMTSYDNWLDIFLPTIERFNNPIYIGHSFGGLLALLYPQLETLLKGVVLLNICPELWLEEATAYALQKGLPDLSAPIRAFEEDPSPQNIQLATEACLPYDFCTPESQARGREMMAKRPFNYNLSRWWLKKMYETNFAAQWVPEKIPALVMGGAEDYMTPFYILARDPRFHRSNIQLEQIMGAGHFPWIEKPQDVRQAFERFLLKLENGKAA